MVLSYGKSEQLPGKIFGNLANFGGQKLGMTSFSKFLNFV